MKDAFMRLPEIFIYIEDKRIHIVGWFIAIVEEMFAWSIVDAELKESSHILDIVHRLSVFAITHHRESSAGNLVKQIVNISPVSLSKYHSRTNDGQTVVAVGSLPFTIFALCEEFGTSV